MTMRAGAHNSLLDLAGVRVGHAEQAGESGKTGCTAIVFDRPAVAACDCRGGAPATRETDLLGASNTVSHIDGIVLSGGSAFGLASADGAMRALRAQGRGFLTASGRVPIVPAAAVFDGRDQPLQEIDYAALGMQAVANAVSPTADNASVVGVGQLGAGVATRSADARCGVGEASFVLPEGGQIAALMVVNPFGTVFAPDGGAWAQSLCLPVDGVASHGSNGGDMYASGYIGDGAAGLRQNTVIGLVVTDLALERPALQRLAICAHDGIARAVRPSHTPYDGDVIFAISTAAVASGAPLSVACALAADVVSRAITRSIISPIAN